MKAEALTKLFFILNGGEQEMLLQHFFGVRAWVDSQQRSPASATHN